VAKKNKSKQGAVRKEVPINEPPVMSGAVMARRPHAQSIKLPMVAFVSSIMLTAFSFLAVAYAIASEAQVARWFVIAFILFLALFQAIIQLFVWMHLKDKGHGVPIFGIAMGFFVALTCVLAGTVWSWLY
jgi:cytochrome c oxidase subunit 4